MGLTSIREIDLVGVAGTGVRRRKSVKRDRTVTGTIAPPADQVYALSEPHLDG